MKTLLYKPIKLNLEDSNVCFWSDTHFGHRCESWESPLWKLRGFETVEKHDLGLIQRWNEVSTTNSTFFHLGDFIFGFDTIERFKTILNQVQFKTLYIMPGNHCSGWKQNFEFLHGNIMHLNSEKKVFFVPNYIEAIINNQPIVMSHYPLASHNGQAKGSWMLHGHCHGNLYKSELGPILYKAKILDIGVENSPFPQTLQTLKQKFSNYSTITFDHHTMSTLNPF